MQKLREAERAGWRRDWWYYRDWDPMLASIRDTPEFRAVFTDIEADMRRQRESIRESRAGTRPVARGRDATGER
jgi:hypothetical protein